MNLLEKANTFVQDNKMNMIETFRPTYHLAPEYGWMNDPNGFVYYQGEYHLFYQANPYDSKWDTMHWAHAKSKDLVEWEYLPIAIAPDQPYDKNGCFSGSAIVVDDKLVLMYTGVYEEDGIVSQVQCIATSTDGIHFEKHVNNPVIDQANLGEVGTTVDFRDPKVFKRGDTYYSVVASKTLDEQKSQGQIFIFSSSDLIEWSQASVLLEGNDQLGNIWECPDLFEIDGEDILVLSPMNMPMEGNQYQNLNSSIAFLGKVDWETLSFEVKSYHEIDHGLDYYAPQTCLDDQGRRIIVAWQQMWGRTNVLDELQHGWSGMMTFPRVLSVEDGKLIQTIPTEFYDRLSTLGDDKEEFKEQHFIENEKVNYLKIESASELTDLSIKIGNDTEEYFSINLEENVVSISRKYVNPEITGEATYTNERSMDINPVNAIELVIDASSIEVFIDGKAMSSTVYFDSPIKTIEIHSETKETKEVTISEIN